MAFNIANYMSKVNLAVGQSMGLYQFCPECEDGLLVHQPTFSGPDETLHVCRDCGYEQWSV